MGLGPIKAPPPHYESIRYSFEDRVSAATPVLDQAICELLATVQSVVLLCTEEATARWITTNELAKHLKHERPLFRDLPDGASEKKRWEIFEITRAALSHEPIAEAGETEGPDEIVVNITHGFRAQPMLGLAAVSFVLSEWARQEIKDPPRLRVLYGAFDQKVEATNVAPIWDLTEFVTASRWNASLDALMRYGRADDLAQLAKIDGDARSKAAREQGKTGSDLKAERFVTRFGAAAKSFADDLALGRLLKLFTDSAPRLDRLLRGDEIDALVARLPPLSGTVEMLRERVVPLCAPNVLGRAGLLATASLAVRYGELQRFAEQAATIREGLVTHYAHLTGRASPPEPGQPGCTAGRKAIEDGWGPALAGVKRKGGVARLGPIADNANLSSAVVDLRNDIEHCGLRDQPIPAQSLIEQLKTSTEVFSTLVAKVETSAPPTQCPVFINLSNHPVASWPVAQIDAARALCLGDPCDLVGGLPDIDPSDDAGKVLVVARAVAERVVAQGAAGAFIAGEYTLSVALIASLQAEGVRCFAATSRREVAETEGDGDSRERKIVFRFVRWREYPALARGG